MCVCVHVQYVFIRVCVYVSLAVPVDAIAPPTRPRKLWDLVRRVCPCSGQAEVVALHRGDLPCSNVYRKELHVCLLVRFLRISWMGGKGEAERVQLHRVQNRLYIILYLLYLLASHMHNEHTSNPKGKGWKAPDAPNVDSCVTLA